MKLRFYKALIKKLLFYAERYKLEVLRNDKLYLVLRDHNYYVIHPKFKRLDYIKVFIVDVRTNKIKAVYKSKSPYYKNVASDIIRLSLKLNYRKLNE